MTKLTVKTQVADLFDDNLRQYLLNVLHPDNPDDIIGVSDSFSCDDTEISPDDDPSVWRTVLGSIQSESLFTAPTVIVRQTAAAYFHIFGCDAFDAAPTAALKAMAKLKRREDEYFVIATWFGCLIISDNPTLDLVHDARDRKLDRIDQKVLDANIRMIIDSGIDPSQHPKAAEQVDRFIATMIEQTLGGREDRAKWQKFYDGITIAAA